MTQANLIPWTIMRFPNRSWAPPGKRPDIAYSKGEEVGLLHGFSGITNHWRYYIQLDSKEWAETGRDGYYDIYAIELW